MILTYALLIPYLVLGAAIGLVLGGFVLGLIAGSLYTIVWNALLIAAAPCDITQEVNS